MDKAMTPSTAGQGLVELRPDAAVCGCDRSNGEVPETINDCATGRRDRT
jgi:hypothetical protein